MIARGCQGLACSTWTRRVVIGGLQIFENPQGFEIVEGVIHWHEGRAGVKV